MPLELIVHRGSREIGGSCIEARVGETRLLFDAGLPLKGDPGVVPALPPTVWKSSVSLAAVFLSHAHCDHAGLINTLPASARVWMTPETSKAVLAAALFTRQKGVDRERIDLMLPGVPVQVGPLRVTALPVDHSIFGAVGFLIEAEGKRVVYTGDLRMHGRKPGMVRRFIDFVKAGGPVDVLLIEGTRLGDRVDEANISEEVIATTMACDIADAQGAVLVSYSPLNLDRFVSVFKSRGRRAMVIDPYQAFVLHLIASPQLPDPLMHPDLRVVAPPSFMHGRAARCLRKMPWFDALRARLSDPAEMLARPEHYVLLYRDSMRGWLFPGKMPFGVTFAFSYWPGYLREEAGKRMQDAVNDVGGLFVVRHASGHAHWHDLRAFAMRIAPRLLVPVHTSSPDTWRALHPNTRVFEDGYEYRVA